MKNILHFDFGDPIVNNLLGYTDELNNLYQYTTMTQPKFPVYNIRKDEEKHYIEVALAGYDKDELVVETEGNTLAIKTAADRKTKECEYVVKNIAVRNFELKFKVATGTKVKKADMENGILTVVLETDKANRKQTVKIG